MQGWGQYYAEQEAIGGTMSPSDGWRVPRDQGLRPRHCWFIEGTTIRGSGSLGLWTGAKQSEDHGQDGGPRDTVAGCPLCVYSSGRDEQEGDKEEKRKELSTNPKGIAAFQGWRGGSLFQYSNCPTACGIFPTQGSNLSLQHWQADSLPLSDQWAPP